MRKTGADPMLIASRHLMALVMEISEHDNEPSMQDALATLKVEKLDLVLTEAFKHSAIAKLELHQPSLRHPLMYPKDRDINAVVSDETLSMLQTPFRN